MEIDSVDATVVACCQVAPVLGGRAANRELAAGAVSRSLASTEVLAETWLALRAAAAMSSR